MGRKKEDRESEEVLSAGRKPRKTENGTKGNGEAEAGGKWVL
jgi:hypothetical protein